MSAGRKTPSEGRTPQTQERIASASPRRLGPMKQVEWSTSPRAGERARRVSDNPAGGKAHGRNGLAPPEGFRRPRRRIRTTERISLEAGLLRSPVAAT
jgi:hypothetical protein